MFSKEVRHQLLATLCANIMTIGFGTAVGWTSASLLILKSADLTPLPTGPLTVEEVSWVGALLYFGGLCGNYFYGFLSGKYGRKWPLVGTAIPQIIGWLLIIFAVNPGCLYAARLLLGLAGGGVYVIIPVYVAEISDNRVRGTLGSLFVLSSNFGIVVAFVLGHYLSYIMSPIIMAIIPVIFLVAMPFFPDTPSYLLKAGKEEAAENALRFYKNLKQKSKEEIGLLKTEMDKLKVSTIPKEKTDSKDADPVTWRDFVTPVARKAMIIGLAILALKQFSGLYVLVNYAGSIFKDAGSTLSPNISAIIIGVIQLVGTYVPTLLVDRAGRRILLTCSAIGTALGLISLGVYMSLKTSGYTLDGLAWIPIASLSFVLFIGCCGVVPLPFIIISETMPQKIRAAGSSCCMAALWIYAFIMIKTFPPLQVGLGLHGCMFLFAGFATLGAVFVILVLPETKGKSFDEITRLMETRSKLGCC